MSKQFSGKVALVTGASSGIGAETAAELAVRGSSVAIVGRNRVNLEKTASQCIAAGLLDSEVLRIVADLENEAEIKTVVPEVIKHFGKLDILVNSAGILTTGSTQELKMEEFDKTFNVNVRSVLLLTRDAIPHLISTKGNIVNVSSVTGIRAFPNLFSYCVSKAAVDQMTRCTALDLADNGVRVNSVNPGVIVTEIHKRGGMDDEAYQKFLEHGKNTHAMGRVGQVGEVAKTIAFLASDESSFITGQNIAIDGGRSIMCPR